MCVSHIMCHHPLCERDGVQIKSCTCVRKMWARVFVRGVCVRERGVCEREGCVWEGGVCVRGRGVCEREGCV